MAKSIYVGSGTAQKVKKIYFGDGNARKVKRGYIGGPDNLAHLFFTGATKWKKYNTTETITHYWNRFNLVSTTTYTWDKYEYKFIGYEYSYYRGDTLYLSISQTTRLYRSIRVNEDGDIEFVGSYTYYRDFSDRGDYSSANGWYLQHGRDVCEIYDAISNQRVDVYRIEVERGESKYEKGSYLGTVTSTNSSQYPNNGQSGSYWYQNRRSSTDYSKGTANGSVSSTSRSQYPDNNYSGSYWYVYDRQESSYSQGTYIQDVENDDPKAYPDNGRHTDGYWYVKIAE